MNQMYDPDICSFCYYFILYSYSYYMQIPPPQHPHLQNSLNQDSIQDACFHIKSQYLIEANNKNKIQQFQNTFQNNFALLKQGFVDKKTLNTTWHSRYFVLTTIRLLYYSNEEKLELKGCFNLASLAQHGLELKIQYPEIGLLVKVTQQGTKSNKILILLHVIQKNNFDDWVKQISCVVSRVKSMIPQQIKLFPHIKPQNLVQQNQKIGKSNINFWNKLTISTSQLLRYASHLDILFLRSKNPLFYFHRFFMRSYYDHVAVLIKDETERIYLFEAVQGKGVCIGSLQSLLHTFHEQYQQMGYRKLIVDQKNLHLDKLQEYINSLVGKKYQLSISKLLIGNQAEQSEQKQNFEETGSEGKSQRTYFCSELIADIYLKFGILSQGKSNHFWPKDFQENELKLGNDFSLSPLMQVQIESPTESSDNSQIE